MAQLSARVASTSAKARSAIQQNNRVSALAALRSKKLNETALAQRSETLAQLEEIYSKIEQSADQVTVVNVMAASAAVLRNLHTRTGQVERVEDVVEGLKNEMRNVDEISRVLEAGGQDDRYVDEISVDEELGYMERQARLEEEKAQTLKTHERFVGVGDVDSASKIAKHQQSMTKDVRNSPIKEGIEALKRLSPEVQAAPDHEKRDATRVSTDAELELPVES